MTLQQPERSLRRGAFLLGVGIAALLSAACAVPLGPGYTVEKQQFDVRYVPGQPPHLEVRASYTLKNTGNGDLAFIEAILLDEREATRSSLRILVDGTETTAQNAATDKAPRKMRIPFASPWPRKQKRSIVVEYQLKIPIGASAAVEGFYLGTSGWYPEFQPPKGLFAKGGERSEKWDLTVHVPDGFLVHASGKLKGTKRRAGEAEHRFRQSPDDFDPFIVSGRYHEQRVSVRGIHGIQLSFWTRQPHPKDEISRASQHLVETIKACEASFGPAGDAFWVVEGMPSKGSPKDEESDAAGDSIPAGVLFNQTAVAYGVASEDSLKIADREIARTWLEHISWPLEETDKLMASVIVRNADVITRNEFDRSPSAAISLQEYEQGTRATKERPLKLLVPGDSPEHYEIAYQKAVLFILALRDKVGQENLRAGFRHMLRARRGDSWSLEDLRSALEAETGQDLAEFFRVWLNQPGIPEDFRKRYQK